MNASHVRRVRAWLKTRFLLGRGRSALGYGCVDGALIIPSIDGQGRSWASTRGSPRDEMWEVLCAVWAMAKAKSMAKANGMIMASTPPNSAFSTARVSKFSLPMLPHRDHTHAYCTYVFTVQYCTACVGQRHLRLAASPSRDM